MRKITLSFIVLVLSILTHTTFAQGGCNTSEATITSSNINACISEVNNGGRTFVDLRGKNITIDLSLDTITEPAYFDLTGAQIAINPITPINTLWMVDTTNASNLKHGGVTISGGHYLFGENGIDLIHFMGGAFHKFSDAIVRHVATIATFGAGGNEGPKSCARSEISDVHATSKSEGNTFITVRNATGLKIQDITATSFIPYARDAYVLLAPTDNGFIDTVFMDNISFQSYSQKYPGAAPDGANDGLKFVTRYGKIVNVWVADSVFDHTIRSGIAFLNGGSSNTDPTNNYFRHISLENIRNDADDNWNVFVRSTGTPIEDVDIISPHFHNRNPSPYNNSIIPSNVGISFDDPHLLVTP